MPPAFLLSRSSNLEYSFALTAENGEPVLTSEMYRTKAAAQGGIQSVRDNSLKDPQYERRPAPGGGHFFILKGADGEAIGHSSVYPYLDALERGVNTVKRVARRAPVKENP